MYFFTIISVEKVL